MSDPKYDEFGNYMGYDKYSQYQMYREKQRESYFADEEVVSLEEYEYQIEKREEKIRELQRALDASRNLQAELDKIKSVLFIGGVIHERDEPVCLSEKVSWVIERQRYRINELGWQVDDDDST